MQVIFRIYSGRNVGALYTKAVSCYTMTDINKTKYSDVENEEDGNCKCNPVPCPGFIDLDALGLGANHVSHDELIALLTRVGAVGRVAAAAPASVSPDIQPAEEANGESSGSQTESAANTSTLSGIQSAEAKAATYESSTSESAADEQGPAYG